MRIIVTSDLHYNVARSQGPTQALAREICRLGGDLLLFVGDSASVENNSLDEVFGLFESFGGDRLAVAGNHELWTYGGRDSLHRYENEVAEACSRNGVHYLDRQPYIQNGLAVVGNVGWYDYSFRTSIMKVPLRFYQHKTAPGAANRLAELEHLFTPGDDIPEESMQITTRWMDGQRVNLPVTDVAFTHVLVDKLRAHLEQVHNSTHRVIAAIHHLPFFELVIHSVLPNWEFVTGFMGSELFGETLLEFPKVSHVFCGHSHRHRRCTKRHLESVSIGSTYTEKQYEVLDL